MKLTIQVNEGPYQHQASDSAWHFTEAALRAGHDIVRVFFYHDGVNNGTRLSVPPQDDRNISERWTELGQKHGLEVIDILNADATLNEKAQILIGEDRFEARKKIKIDTLQNA